MHTERTEMLPTSLMNLGQNRRTNQTSASSAVISTEDSIYTFSDNCNSDNDESDTIDHERFTSKYVKLASSTVTEPNQLPSSPFITDRNLNNTRNSTLKNSIRTYSKKRPPPTSTTSFSPKTSTMTSSNFNNSCLSLPSPGSMNLSPPSDDSNYNNQLLNGKLKIRQPCIGKPCITKCPFTFNLFPSCVYQLFRSIAAGVIQKAITAIIRWKTKSICNVY